jgi:hypothetical protein
MSEMRGEVFVQPPTDPEDFVPSDEDVAVLDGRVPQLHLSLDRKVSPDGWYQDRKSRWVPTVPNSFGLPAGESCPGKTEFCNDCYAVNSERSKGVKEAMDHNLRLLKEAGTVDAMSELLTDGVHMFEKIADRRDVPKQGRMFRVHWDGDFFSVDYAKAWAKTMRLFPNITFWAYTRSFVEPVDVLPELVDVPNLALYLSTDKYNVDAAHEMLQRYPGRLNLAACDNNFVEARDLVRGRRAVVCPENLGRFALMNRSRHDESRGEGACVRCNLCPQSKADIIFSTQQSHVAQIPLFGVPVELIKRPVDVKVS